MMGTKGTRILICALAGFALLGTGASAWLGARLIKLEGQLNGKNATVEAAATTNAVVAATNAATNKLQVAATNSQPAMVAVAKSTDKADSGKDEKNKKQKAAVPTELMVLAHENLSSPYSREAQVVVFFSTKPDLDVLRDYVKVEPQMPGKLVFDYLHDFYSFELKKCADCVRIRGEFPFSTDVVLTIKKGCPALRASGARALAEDYQVRFRRCDLLPKVMIAEKGRYLPAGGNRLLAVESVNTDEIICAAAAIPSANIVQLLAREDCKYRGYWESIDSSYTKELADLFKTWKVSTKGKCNERVITPLELQKLPDAVSNGVFLVAVGLADKRDVKPENLLSRDTDKNDFRLVCVTDLGLTIRRSGNVFYVWTTSLTTGSPVPQAEVELYGANNRLLASRTSNSMGLARIAYTGKQEPFAFIVRTRDGSDRTFLSIASDLRAVEENAEFGEPYLAANAVEAFLWTERDIYRHGEKIFVHALTRTGRMTSPRPFPLVLELRDPDERKVATRTVMTDARGAVSFDGFSVPDECMSGKWQIVARTPGRDGRNLGSIVVSVEEFVPPQVRVTVTGEGSEATNFAFTVKAENLYGGPARKLPAQGAVVFLDAAFNPEGWKGWTFGDETLGLKPSWRRLDRTNLDTNGVARFTAGLLAESGLPKAAVKAIGEGTVFEAGGRVARSRCQQILHHYPFYIGSTLGDNLRLPENGFPRVKVACVRPNGSRLAEARTLRVTFKRISSTYSCKEDSRGWTSWVCDRVAIPCPTSVKTISTRADGGDVEFEIPFRVTGDYEVVLTDDAANVSFGKQFWLGDRGDDDVRAPLANPSAVTLSLDKKLYRPGDVPRLLVKAPFAGWGCLSIMRDQVLSTKIVHLDGPTAELTLDPVSTNWTPCVDVALSVVQSAKNGGRRQVARAHGVTTLMTRRYENEIPVTVKSEYRLVPDCGGDLTVDLLARSAAATGEVAVVTVVDEGINLLTNRRIPAPVKFFARARTGEHPLYDLFDRLLPIWDGDPLKVTGYKTGGGMGAEMLGRVSPVPTRRFKPLALWRTEVPLTNGAGRVTLRLPEFVGEVRVTAFAYSDKAVGVAETHQKVSPKLILMPDAPRFVAPNDQFSATLTLVNRSGAAGDVNWTLQLGGPVTCDTAKGTLHLAKDESRTLTLPVKVANSVGEAVLAFRSEGLGERHVQVIELPVRPAAAAREAAGVIALAPGESHTFTTDAQGIVSNSLVRTFRARGSELARLTSALAFLAQYPHGCLEQTTSRIFPLVAAGGLLNTIPVADNAPTNRKEVIEAGFRRVLSMFRWDDFVMWPDCDYPPWDREVSVYAAHFLFSAQKAGCQLPDGAREGLVTMLRKWTMPNASNNCEVVAYACQTLALVGSIERDKMLRLYDASTNLTLLARARLARAFVLANDRPRANDLLRDIVPQPVDVREAATVVLALLDLDPNDARITRMIDFIERKRSPVRCSWGTTGENAHALMALAAYYRHHPVQTGTTDLRLVAGQAAEQAIATNRATLVRSAVPVTVRNCGTGTAWLTWRELSTPVVAAVTNESAFIQIRRSYYSAEGKPYDLAKARRGDLLVAALHISAPTATTFNDLVIQDLLPAAFEPVLGGLNAADYPWIDKESSHWIMRTDARDDRQLVFSKKFDLALGKEAVVYYPVRIVSCGTFTLPGPTVEAMYAPEVRAVVVPTQLTVQPD